jgi:hypothetical protein
MFFFGNSSMLQRGIAANQGKSHLIANSYYANLIINTSAFSRCWASWKQNERLVLWLFLLVSEFFSTIYGRNIFSLKSPCKCWLSWAKRCVCRRTKRTPLNASRWSTTLSSERASASCSCGASMTPILLWVRLASACFLSGQCCLEIKCSEIIVPSIMILYAKWWFVKSYNSLNWLITFIHSSHYNLISTQNILDLVHGRIFFCYLRSEIRLIFFNWVK